VYYYVVCIFLAQITASFDNALTLSMLFGGMICQYTKEDTWMLPVFVNLFVVILISTVKTTGTFILSITKPKLSINILITFREISVTAHFCSENKSVIDYFCFAYVKYIDLSFSSVLYSRIC